MALRTDDLDSTARRDVGTRGPAQFPPRPPAWGTAGGRADDTPSSLTTAPAELPPSQARRPESWKGRQDAPRSDPTAGSSPTPDAAGAAISAIEVLPPARPVRPGLYRQTVKRGIDLVLVALAAPLVAPLVGLLALLVARSGGQPFYCQSRIGRDGRPYRMWKLRTMVPDADARLEAHLRANPAARAEWNSKQKLLDDPRITPVGHVLRKASLDELPQLWNVARGDMSLVGPRPMMVTQQRLYPGRDYYELRPGITGLWQISDRNASTFADRAKFDTVYNRTLSMGLDLGILISTVRVVLRGTGH